MKLLLTLASVVSIALVGCSESPEATETEHSTYKPPVTSSNVKDEVKGATDAVAQFAAQKRDEYAADLQDKMDELDVKIEKLKAKSADVKDDAKAKWDDKMKALQAKREAAAEKFAKMKDASGDAWEEMRSGLQKSWEELREAFDDASAELESNDE